MPPTRCCVDVDRPLPDDSLPTDDPVPVFDDVLTREAVAAYVARSRRRGSGAAFQALLAAAEATVRGVLGPLREAAGAALSLSQQQTLAGAEAHLAAGADALHEGLSAEGLALAPGRGRGGWLPRLRAAAAELTGGNAATERAPSWVVALAAAVEALGSAAEHVTTLAQAQPPDSSARALGLGVAEQLTRHRDALLRDAARLME